MCTAINDISKFHLFGRTLDLEATFNEQVVISPRSFPFSFIYEGATKKHFAIIGTAHVVDGKPLYFDGMNEHGLCAAALRFPELTVYHDKIDGKNNLASFELIPWILCNFKCAEDAAEALKNVNITPESISDKLPSTELHWIIADKNRSYVLESREDGLKIYDNPYGVLANAPDFPTQCFVLDKFGDPVLGDLSSSSRFNRAVNAVRHTLPAEEKVEAISRLFHIFSTVNQPHGLFRADERQLRTVYTSCMDTEDLVYYFTTYTCRQIHSVRLHNDLLDNNEILSYPMAHKENIEYLN